MQFQIALRVGIWLYFWLILFEGVLRKWVLPEYSDPIFLIRDPVVILIYACAAGARLFPIRPATVTIWTMAVAALLFSFTGESPFAVTLFGLRTNFLHLPLVFVIAETFNRRDVVRMGAALLVTSIPIFLLMLVQFNSDPKDLINTAVGGTGGLQLRGALGKIRPPGPFSFISGVVSFIGLATAFLVYGWQRRGTFPLWLLIGGTLAVAASVPISISRSVLLSLLVVGSFAVVLLLRDRRTMGGVLGPVVAAGALLAFMGDTIYVQAFVQRWDEANAGASGGFQGSVVDRTLDQFTQPFETAVAAPLLGHGVGLGTVAGSRLATGNYGFLLSEGELTRAILELGPLLGMAFICWRTWLAGLIVLRGWSVFVRTGDTLGWLIAGASFLSVFYGQWGPSTNLGFSVLGAGLALAALNDPAELDGEPEGEDDDGEEPATPSAAAPEDDGEAHHPSEPVPALARAPDAPRRRA
jgi:hypothetical protein